MKAAELDGAECQHWRRLKQETDVCFYINDQICSPMGPRVAEQSGPSVGQGIGCQNGGSTSGSNDRRTIATVSRCHAENPTEVSNTRSELPCEEKNWRG
jgi:hypothetical protein